MEKPLEDASIKVSMVASNITGVSSRPMLPALMAGQRDLAILAQLAKGKMRAKIPELTEALTANSMTTTKSRSGRYPVGCRLDELIVIEIAPRTHQLDLLVNIPGVGRQPRKCSAPRRQGTWAGLRPRGKWPSGQGRTGEEPIGWTPQPGRAPGTATGWLTSTLVEAVIATSNKKNTYLGSQFARGATPRSGTGAFP